MIRHVHPQNWALENLPSKRRTCAYNPWFISFGLWITLLSFRWISHKQFIQLRYVYVYVYVQYVCNVMLGKVMVWYGMVCIYIYRYGSKPINCQNFLTFTAIASACDISSATNLLCGPWCCGFSSNGHQTWQGKKIPNNDMNIANGT